MRIFISFKFSTDKDIFEKVVKVVRGHKHNAYSKDLRGFFGAQGLNDPDVLDEHLRDEDLAIAILSKSYMADRWLREEVQALHILEYKSRPDFLLPILVGDVENSDIPEWCELHPHVDFRVDPSQGFDQLVARLDELAAKPRLLVFVCHSARDSSIARALTTLLATAFDLKPEEILCTDIEDNMLPLSVKTDECLRRMIREAKVFVCIATRNSIGTRERAGSFYVAAELGARWGMNRYLALMLAGGARGDWIKAPFNKLNALSCENPRLIKQFIKQIGEELGRVPGAPATYSAEVDNLVSVSTGALASTAS